MGESGRGNPEVVRPNDLALDCELRPRVRMNARDLFGDFDRLHPTEQMLDESAALRALRAPRSVNAV